MEEDMALKKAMHKVQTYKLCDVEVTHMMFNYLTKSWSNVVKTVLLPGIIERVGEIPEEKKAQLERKLLERLIQHGKIFHILYKYENSIDRVLKVPKELVCPGDEENQKLNEENAPDEQEVLSDIRDLMMEIVQLRKQKDVLQKLKMSKHSSESVESEVDVVM
ncbi:unnamed protein product [Bursaphelenchus okinawaensis]|uniref:Uncharacterized protein n=1 Tax=Bursaphelenchus okinawaensis TaxID=465554 RepID=A0A811LLP2_9BILA|nr:unnamed protein product [Bursaphelenchus okinawaensis]CAG9125949.1 unnamed protein product [Bursaphelenchus okinawaensis]